MNRKSILKISLVVVLLVFGLLSIMTNDKGENVLTSWLAVKDAPEYDTPLYVTGIGLRRESFVCIHDNADSLDGSTINPNTDCLVKLTNANVVEEGVLRGDFLLSDETYRLDIFIQDDCKDEYTLDYTTTFTTGNEGPIIIALGGYNENLGGDNNHYCNNGKYYNTLAMDLYKYYEGEGDIYFSQRNYRTNFYLGRYNEETDTYTIDTSKTLYRDGNEPWSGPSFGTVSSANNYLFETNGNIDAYQCRLDGVEGDKVEINGVKYCVMKLPKLGETSPYHPRIYNTYTGGDVPIDNYDVEVVWDDDDNRDGVRPNYTSSNVGVYVYGNGNFYYSVSIYKSNDWQATAKLPVKDYKDVDINYTFSVYNVPTGYTCSVARDTEEKKIAVTCKHTPATINIKVTNEWKDIIDEEPESVTVNLLRNGEVVETYDLNADEDWEHIFNVYKNENGVVATYGIQQKAIEGFDLQIKGNYLDGYRLINTQVSETRRVNITTEMICGDGTVTGAEQIVYGSDSAVNGIVATAKEGYVINYIKVNGERLDIEENLTTYTLDNFENLTEDVNIETCFKKIKKQNKSLQAIIAFFTNSNTKKGFFTLTLVVSLIYVLALIASKIKNMPVQDLGFNFGLAATAVFISIITLLSLSNNVVTNTVDKKTAMDPTDGQRYIYLTNYRLLNTEIRIDGNTNNYHESIKYTGAQGENIASLGYAYKIPVEPNETYRISLLDMYCNGVHSEPTSKSFTITVGDEDVVYFGGPSVTYYGLEQAPDCVTFVDRRFIVKKEWADSYNQNFYPDSIEISGNVKYYLEEQNAYGTRPYSCTVTAENDWTCETVIEDVPSTWTFDDHVDNVYGAVTESFTPTDANINDSDYYYVCGKTGTEDDQLIGGTCTTNIKSGMIINPEPDVYGIKVTNELKKRDSYTEYEVIKVWNDNDNAAGDRPSSIYVEINATDEKYFKDITLTASDNWKGVVEINDKAVLDYCAEDEPIEYTMDSCVIDEDNKTITVTNTLKKKYTIEKIWNDDNNLSGIRPSGLTVYVNTNLEDYVEYLEANYQYKSTLYINQNENIIGCNEVTPSGYTNGGCVIDEDEKTITLYNTIEDLYTVTKVWNDNNNEYGVRPENVTVYVGATGTNYVKSTIVRASNDWSGTVRVNSDLNGLECYESTPSRYQMTSCIIDKQTKTIIVTNTIYPSYHVKKIWNDNNNEKGIRPSYIDFYYNVPGLSTSQSITSSMNWEGRIFITPEQDERGGITSCSDYNSNYHMDSCEIDQDNRTITVTNSINDYYTIRKVWDDKDNQDNVRPTSTTVTVSASNGSISKNIDVYKSNNWESGVYINPLLLTNGATLSCGEIIPSGFTLEGCEIDSDNKTITVTNKHVPAVTSVRVTKSWEGVDSDDVPDSVEVNLYADGVRVDTATITADDEWIHIFDNLDKYDNGAAIVYTVAEKMVDGYYVNVSGNATSGYVITNKKTEETRRVNIRTSVICGEGTITGDEELIYGAHSTPYLIVATGALGYKIDYILFNDERKDFPDLTGKYALSGFYNVTEDKDIKVCFVESKELLEEELDGGDEDPDDPPGGDNSSNNNEDPINPNTADKVVIFIVLIAISLLLFVKLDKKYKFLR